MAQTEELAFKTPPLFTKLGYDQGYPEPIVLKIFQDDFGFIWIGTVDGGFRYDGYKFKEFRRDQKEEQSLLANIVYDISQSEEKLLFNCHNQGLSILDQQAGVFENWTFKNGKLPAKAVWDYHIDKEGTWWAASEAGLLIKRPEESGLAVYKPSKYKNQISFLSNCTSIYETRDGHLWVNSEKGVTVYSPENETWTILDTILFKGNSLRTFHEDPSGRIWLGGRNGLYHYDRGNKTMTGIGAEGPMQLSHQNIQSIQYGPDGRLWVGTFDGLNALDLVAQKNSIFKNDPNDENSLSQNRITKLFLDRQGLLWIGSWGGALQYIDFQKRPFKTIASPPLSNGDVNAIAQFDHKTWIGLEDGGVNVLDLESGEINFLDSKDGLSTDKVYCFESWEEQIWMGMGNGLAINAYHPANGSISQYNASNSDLPNMTTWAMAKDQEGNLWLGMTDGLAKVSGLDENNQLIIDELYLNNSFFPSVSVRSLLVDSDNDLWIGTDNLGLIHYQIQENSFQVYNNESESHFLPDEYINCIYEDSRGHIWVGTPVGAAQINKKTGVIKTVSEADGLPNNYVFKIAEDNQGQIWMTTNRGLVRYDSDQGRIKKIIREDGLQSNEFNQGAGFQANGILYFGTTTGLLVVTPNDIPFNRRIPPVIFTKVQYRNKKSTGEPIEIKGIGYREQVKLNFRDEFIEIDFVALNFQNAQKNQYRYQLRGASQQWFNLGNDNRLTLVDLDPGTYDLHVQGSNNDGVWNEEGAKLRIIITPPFWATKMAYFIYGTIFFLLLLFSYRRILNRKLEKAEVLRRKELDEAKTRFFTNIAHEFKTPLTVILGLVQEWKGSEKHKALLFRSVNNMRNLINQVLELRRLEKDQLPVRYAQHNVVDLTRNTIETYASLAEQQNIKIHFEAATDRILMDIDQEKWLRILSNLLSNAIKYNQEGGAIWVSLNEHITAQDKMLILQVCDSGIGIPQTALPRIFERFYQVDETSRSRSGTGVGLALTRELVKIMEGQIAVESQVGKGTSFTVELPITNEAEPIAHGTGKVENIAPLLPLNGIAKNQETTVLIIEDNTDIASYLKDLISREYEVMVASDGQAGIELALQELPDIIVSDVMMPRKDGFEVLNTLKTDTKTSHIPIVLLTAKAEIKDRLQGLEQGADAYLGKPFHPDELLANLKSLVQNRKRVQAFYQEKIQNATEDEIQALDPFLVEVRRIILDNLDNDEFYVNDLCQEMHVSRTQLHKKLKALTGKSTTHFVNEVKVSEGKKCFCQRIFPLVKSLMP